jgi:hypothetical protein
VDTIARVVIMIGSGLTYALLFVPKVLSVKWRKIIASNKDNRNRKSQQQKYQSEHGVKSTSGHLVKSKTQTQTLVQLKRLDNWNELINKKVKTCETADIGHVVAIDNQSMTVLHYTKQEYVIPTYYIREYDQDNVMIDISVRYLYHYKSEEKLQQPHRNN